MGGVELKDWSDWIRTITAVAAFLFAPAGLQALWTRLRHRFTAICYPATASLSKGSHEWQIELRNRSSTMRPFKVDIYPKQKRNRISSFKIITENDGGMLVDSAVLAHGCLVVDVVRIAPGRRLSIKLVFDTADVPRFHATTNSITSSIGSPDRYAGIPSSRSLEVGRKRVLALCASFVSGFVVLFVSLFWHTLKF